MHVKILVLTHIVLSIFIALALPNTSSAQSSGQIIFTQPVNDVALGANFIDYRQTISCDDLAGKIDEVSISMTRTGLFSANWRMVITESVLNGKSYTSDNTVVLGPRYTPTDLHFTFQTPVDVDNDLCVNSNAIMLLILPDHTDQNNSTTIAGSNNNIYPNGYFSTNSTSQGDIYVVIKGDLLQNTTPTLAPIATQTVSEGDALEFTVSATDPDNDILTYSASNLPAGATFDAETQTFSWAPGYNDAGTYDVTFAVTDNGEPVASDSETVTIIVENTNRAPVLVPIGNQIVSEGDALQFMILATDPDGDTLTYSASNLPADATFDAQTQTFSWTPGYSDAGNYTDVEFTVVDNGSPMELAVELITITVGDINRAPALTNPGPQEVLEDTSLTFTISAVDPDGDVANISASGMPIGSTFDGTTFIWTPSLTQEGVYTITFAATDDGVPNETAFIDVVITVGDNPTPIEQAENIVETVVNLDLPQNIENSYLANLQKVAEFIASGKTQAAINQLQAFVNKIEQDYTHNVLTVEEYESLMNMAVDLIEEL